MKLLSVVLFSMSVSYADAIYTGGTGVIAMDVAPYGGTPNVAVDREWSGWDLVVPAAARGLVAAE